MFYWKIETEPGVYVTRLKNLEINSINESNEFLEGDPDVSTTFPAEKKKKSMGIKEVLI